MRTFRFNGTEIDVLPHYWKGLRGDDPDRGRIDQLVTLAIRGDDHIAGLMFNRVCAACLGKRDAEWKTFELA